MNNKSYKHFELKGFSNFVDNINQYYQNLDINNVDDSINTLLNTDNYMNKIFFRIRSIEIWNFRNIEHGKVLFPNCKSEEIYESKPSVLGLYGQNGSGKTSVIMAISILKDLLSGRSLSSKYESCIRHNFEKCSLSFELVQGLLVDDDNLPDFSYYNQIYYSFDIIKTEETNEDGSAGTKLHVVNEVLSGKQTDNFGNRIKTKQKLFDARPSESDEKGRPFGNKTRFLRIVGNDKDLANKLRDAKVVAYDRSTSFIFSNNTSKALIDQKSIAIDKYNDTGKKIFEKLSEIIDLIPEKLKKALSDIGSIDESSDEEFERVFDEWLEECTEEQLEQLKEKWVLIEQIIAELDVIMEDFPVSYDRYIFYMLIELLTLYGKHFLFTIDTTSTGLINVNEQWPILLWRLDSQKNPHANRVYLNLDKPSSIQEKDYAGIKASLSSVSKVLSSVVPGLSLEMVDMGKQIANDGKATVCIFEIMSNREGNLIPLRYESDGVRRLVSILSLLIAAYNQPFFTIAIDEIDSGIFEYLLGEILKILSVSAKGQIVFTSHNLRPLEVLPPRFLCFTTTNPEKKFVRLQNRGNSNFRDGYFRNIVLGTSDEAIYNPTDPFEIEMAFYEAGLERGEDYE